MQLINKINTEAEYKAACTAYGEHVIAILNYILTQRKESTFNGAISNSEMNVHIKKIENLKELITEVTNARLPTAPEFN